MRSKIFLLIVLLILVSNSGVILAQAIQEPRALIPAALPELPDPGLKPGDFFYFLDEWGEAIEEFFTFRPEYRAWLQTERVLERVAEIKALVKRDGIDSPYLIKTKKRIRDNMDRAAKILEQQEAKGIEISFLAEQLDYEFDMCQAWLKQVFWITKEGLKTQEKILEDQIRKARLDEDFKKVNELRTTLVNIRSQKDSVDNRVDFLEEILEAEEERIEIKMEDKEREFEVSAGKAEDLFDQREKDLERVFKQREKGLEVQEKALEVQLKQAILVEDAVLAEQIKNQLTDLKDQEEVLEVEKETSKRNLGRERFKLAQTISMKERAAEQIKEAREEILDVKEEKAEMIAYVIKNLPVVLRLISQAESKLVIAEEAFAEGNYGKAFGQAMAAEMLARNAGKMLEEKIENFIECIGEGERGNIFKHETCCKGLTRVSTSIPYNGDCIPPLPCGNFICTKCGNGICGLGENWCNCPQDCERAEKEVDKIKEIEKKIEKIEDFLNIRIRDERILTCIRECSVEIGRAKDCAFDIIPKNMRFEEVLRDIRIKTRLKRDCLDEALLARTCLKKEDCYQLFINKLKKTRSEIYEVYKRLSPLLPGLTPPIRRPDNDRFCVQVFTPAINPLTGECIVFRDSCQIPEGWRVVMEGCPPTQNEIRIPDIR